MHRYFPGHFRSAYCLHLSHLFELLALFFLVEVVRFELLLVVVEIDPDFVAHRVVLNLLLMHIFERVHVPLCVLVTIGVSWGYYTDDSCL